MTPLQRFFLDLAFYGILLVIAGLAGIYFSTPAPTVRTEISFSSDERVRIRQCDDLPIATDPAELVQGPCRTNLVTVGGKTYWLSGAELTAMRLGQAEAYRQMVADGAIEWHRLVNRLDEATRYGR